VLEELRSLVFGDVITAFGRVQFITPVPAVKGWVRDETVEAGPESEGAYHDDESHGSPDDH
jgi:hypothetical protein